MVGTGGELASIEQDTGVLTNSVVVGQMVALGAVVLHSELLHNSTVVRTKW